MEAVVTPIESDEALEAAVNTAIGLKKTIDDLKSQLDTTKEQIIDYIGEGGKRTFYDGDVIVSVSTRSVVRRLDTKSLKADCPELYKDYSRESIQDPKLTIRTKVGGNYA